jgi:TldD protein
VRRLVVAIFLLGSLLSQPAQAAADPVLDAMREELTRSFAVYNKASVPAYFLAYRINDDERVDVNAEFGVLQDSSSTRTRALNVEMRTGDYSLDNTHPLRTEGFSPGYARGNNWQRIGLEAGAGGLAQQIWRATDAAYWQAVEHLAKVRANTAIKAAAEDRSDDFSHEDKLESLAPPFEFAIDPWIFRQKVKSYSAAFKSDPRIYRAKAGLTVARTTRWLVNSEGTSVRDTRLTYLLDIRAVTKADDGMELPRTLRFLATRPDALPDDATVLAAVRQLMIELAALRAAPLATAYEGPAIIDGHAAGVFFHEVVGHRLEAHRLRQEEDAQTLKKKLNERILPESISIAFDPTLASFNGQALMGGYGVDDDGVKSRPVNVVEEGILKNFLVSRTPIEGFAHSNGHGRSAPGYRPVARQSNMLVSVSNPFTQAALKKALIVELNAQKKPWGLLIREVDGGHTLTQRAAINAAQMVPTMVYRIYVDGREELVRGVNLVGTPLTLLAEVVGADDQYAVTHGWCGAESGYVPVSTVAPDLLLKRIEVQRKPKSQDRPPLLPTPVPEGK